MLNNQFGIYRANGYGSVTTTSVWTGGPTASGAYLAIQCDRNLVIYASGAVWSSGTFISGSCATYCLKMLDNGNLMWVDTSNALIWQSNSAVTG